MSEAYTVSIYMTPMSFPLNFTVHTWVELEGPNDEHHRFDFWGYKGIREREIDHGYVYKDLFPDHLGTTFSPFADPGSIEKRQHGKVYMSISGDVDSEAHTLYAVILGHAFDYPLKHDYNMVFGPNCNTFTQWLITRIPNSPLKLPFNAWGKGYQVL
tara:strand:+ start:1573 stop:2043 length:471 start_codon:yes stop_codon:yes gene_type:complete